VVKKRHTCFFWAFGSPSTFDESVVVSAMLDAVPKQSFFFKARRGAGKVLFCCERGRRLHGKSVATQALFYA